MLNFLQIRDYAIVDSLDLEFAEGFTCVTGETGAGKSILVDALGLLCGNRADTSAVREGADKAELAAEFTVEEDNPALAWLRDAELDEQDRCLLRRVIAQNGRSRAWINGSPVTLTQLAALGELLVEIHGQNEHILLVRQEEQFRLLDSTLGGDRAIGATAQAYRRWSDLENQRRALLAEERLDAGDQELLQYQIRELEDSMLSAEAFRSMESEHRILARGGELSEALAHALELLRQDETGVEAGLNRSVEQLSTFADLDDQLANAVELLDGAAIHCNEAISSIESARSRLDSSPERLAELERQLGIQYDLARKHRVEPDRLESVLEKIRQRHELAGSLETRLAELETQLSAALSNYRDQALGLSELRRKQARKLAGKVTALMQELGMQGGEFRIDVRHDDQRQPSVRGDDELELQVSANPGTQPGPLRKVASGGELSRISLAIKVAAKGGRAAGTQVFDEVDAGIGGDTAHAVGALLKSLSSGSQALCVTHLAQVAVFADRQLQVSKQSDELKTRVSTNVLGPSERVDEIARMLGGRISDQSRAHATELLATASVRH